MILTKRSPPKKIKKTHYNTGGYQMKKNYRSLIAICLTAIVSLSSLTSGFSTHAEDLDNEDKETKESINHVIEEYLHGDKNQDYLVEMRKELVEQKKLQDFVDQDYFLLHEKLKDIEGVYSPESEYSILLNLTPEKDLENMDDEIYKNSETVEDSEDDRELNLDSNMLNVKSTPTYNNHGDLVGVNTGGFYYYGPIFSISNCPGTSAPGGSNHTVYGYCARKNPNNNYDEAPNGTPITRLKKHPNNSIFAKALYYGTDTGYAYAASRVPGWSSAGSSGRKMVIGNTTSWALGHDHYAKFLFKEYYDFCRNAPAAPEGFEAYEAEMNHGRNQTVSFGYFVPVLPKNGFAHLQKNFIKS